MIYHLIFKKYIFRWKLKNLGFIFSQFFFLEILSKFSDLFKFRWLHRRKHIEIFQITTSFLLEKRFRVNKKNIFSIEKLRNSGNCIYDYSHSFFGEDFYFNALYWYYIPIPGLYLLLHTYYEAGRKYIF